MRQAGAKDEEMRGCEGLAISQVVGGLFGRPSQDPHATHPHLPKAILADGNETLALQAT